MNSTNTSTGVAGIVLAAGGSRRFGQAKQLLEWGGRPLVTHIADTAWMAGLDPVIVVVGAAADRVIPLLENRPVQVARNYRWDQGMSSSLQAGIAALPPGIEAALFIPIDQPLISVPLLQGFVRQWRTTRAGIIVPKAPEGQRGTPVLFASEFFPELTALTGDVGGRALFGQHAQRVTYLPISDASILADVDTPETYTALLESTQAAGPAIDWDSLRGLICDMDGVLWRGDSPLPGLEAFFAVLEALQISYMLVTNNSSRTPDQYVEKLRKMGVETTTKHVLNSAMAAARHIAETKPDATVFAIGGPGVRQAVEAEGLAYRDDIGIKHADFVLVGWDQQLTWTKLAAATRLILDGATFVSTNPDRTFPLEATLAPGNGAQTAALTAATGVNPIVAGKPAALLYQQAMARMGTPPESTLVIGDRLDTDILGGIRLGNPTALVLTGVSTADELHGSPIRPTIVFNDLPSLTEAWYRSAIKKEDPHNG